MQILKCGWTLPFFAGLRRRVASARLTAIRSIVKMKSRRSFLKTAALLSAAPVIASVADGKRNSSAGEKISPLLASPADDRDVFLTALRRVSEPVLEAGAARELKRRLPVRAAKGVKDRAEYTHLEAVGRLLCGISAWLELDDPAADAEENALREKYRRWARATVDSISDPASPDFLNFTRGGQPLVDAAFLAQALVRAPRQLLAPLSADTKQRLAAALRSTRIIKPPNTNWICFSAMVEAGLHLLGETYEAARVDHALQQHELWYKGDGVYGDGPEFHADYYNSYVIQPMLLDLASVFDAEPMWEKSPWRPRLLPRAARWAAIQERLIAPDGTYPILGRSITYRCGAFQGLAHVALLRALPAALKPAQVRGALAAVIQRTLGGAENYDEHGWLRIGIVGEQPSLGENYISTGSLYLCAAALLPLGLPTSDPFWSDAPAKWTAQKVWSGEDVPADHALR
jgi:hypothetical protein